MDVTFPNGNHSLGGQIFKPAGNGPFPALLWNHGSERDPRPYLPRLARPFVAAGYVVFAPFRRGHATSPGQYIVDQVQTAPPSARAQLTVQLLEEQVDDQLAGFSFLRDQPYVDATRIAVMGGSYGGIQTLLGAEANPGYMAAIDCAGAAQSWSQNPLLQQRLAQSVRRITVPVFLLQAQNDYNLAPTQVLGALFRALDKPVKITIYPPYGSNSVGAGHLICGGGSDIWAADALDFLSSATRVV
jgi:dipeptidyl aminopeptidase/acylaminoacyl peptidase